MTIDLIVALLIQMLDSIELVHNAGVLHRDIKPSNFVIGKDKDAHRVYLIDFGLSKRFNINDVTQ